MSLRRVLVSAQSREPARREDVYYRVVVLVLGILAVVLLGALLALYVLVIRPHR